MSNDPKHGRIDDQVPSETPELLKKSVDLDRRTRPEAPTIEGATTPQAPPSNLAPRQAPPSPTDFAQRGHQPSGAPLPAGVEWERAPTRPLPSLAAQKLVAKEAPSPSSQPAPAARPAAAAPTKPFTSSPAPAARGPVQGTQQQFAPLGSEHSVAPPLARPPVQTTPHQFNAPQYASSPTPAPIARSPVQGTQQQFSPTTPLQRPPNQATERLVITESPVAPLSRPPHQVTEVLPASRVAVAVQAPQRVPLGGTGDDNLAVRRAVTGGEPERIPLGSTRDNNVAYTPPPAVAKPADAKGRIPLGSTRDDNLAYKPQRPDDNALTAPVLPQVASARPPMQRMLSPDLISTDPMRDAPDDEVETPLERPAVSRGVPADLLTTTPGEGGPTPAPRQPAATAPARRADEVVASPASVWRRVLAWVVDSVVIGGVVGGLLSTAAMLIGSGDSLSAKLLSLTRVALPGLALAALLAFVYTTLFAFAAQGRTLGRRIAGIHLVDSAGHAPGPVRALARAVFALISFGLFLSGFWLALFDRRGQTLHDKLTRTFVVQLQS